MTARVTTLKGDAAGAYYVEQPGRYYVDGDEPEGVWRGRGAEALGLGEGFDEEAFMALLAGLDPRTGQLLGTKHNDRTVRGFDVTFSAPKSVSALFAVGDEDTRREVVAAHDAAVNAVIDWIEDHATVRHRVNGDIWVVDAEGTVSGLFRQHTSRALDPQLHTHAVIVNRSLAPDGRWLALDARTLKGDQRTLSALYHAGLRAELTRRIGVEWLTPVNGIAEMANIEPGVLTEYSKRTEQVDTRFVDKLERFVRDLDRMPTPRERWKLEREAVVDSRPSKISATAADLHEHWVGQVQALGIEPNDLIDEMTGWSRGIGVDEVRLTSVIDQALGALAERQSTWRPAELTREIAAALPTTLALSAAEVTGLAEETTTLVIERDLVDLTRPIPEGVPLRRDGRPVTEASLDRILTTPEILAQEQRLLDLAEQRVEQGGTDHRITVDSDLSGVQHAVASAVAGDRGLVLVVGPAGTGKTTALAPAVDQLRDDCRTAFGVCLSASAADVLSTETGIDADTLDKLLIEHRLERPPDHRYALPPGATVVVDEASMVPTTKLAELFELAERRSWRLALIGDPMQFSAIGRSGMFGHLVDTFSAVELDRVHRFTEQWERDASLALRHGDTDAVTIYDDHGRLHGGTAHQMLDATVGGWWDAIHDGKTATMMAPSREAVLELNMAAQHRRITAGELDQYRPRLDLGEIVLLPGDAVATRQNDRALRTDHGVMVRNRDRWTVQEIHDDHSVTVAGRSGTIRLPADYAAANIELAYAETGHAAQGRTVDQAFLYLDGPTDTPGVYVPMTRGRESNEAFVVLPDDEHTPAELLSDSLARNWIDRPAIAQRQDLPAPGESPQSDRDEPRAPRLLEPTELRNALEREHELRHTLEHRGITPDGRRQAEERIAAMTTERDTLDATVENRRADVANAREFLARHDGPISRRFQQRPIENAHQTIRGATSALESAERSITVLDGQIDAAQQGLADQLDVERRRPDLADEREAVSVVLGNDRALRKFDIADQGAARSITDIIGSQPLADDAAGAWLEAAATIEQHQTAFDLTGGLGPEPSWIDRDLYADNYRETRQVTDDYNQAIGRSVHQQELVRDIDFPRLSL